VPTSSPVIRSIDPHHRRHAAETPRAVAVPSSGPRSPSSVRDVGPLVAESQEAIVRAEIAQTRALEARVRMAERAARRL